jgi:hypothetical protein
VCIITSNYINHSCLKLFKKQVHPRAHSLIFQWANSWLFTNPFFEWCAEIGGKCNGHSQKPWPVWSSHWILLKVLVFTRWSIHDHVIQESWDKLEYDNFPTYKGWMRGDWQLEVNYSLEHFLQNNREGGENTLRFISHEIIPF